MSKDERILNYINYEQIATKRIRFVGFMLSRLISIIFMMGLSYILYLNNFNLELTIGLSLLFMASVNIMLIASKQQTIGMIIMKTKIISDSEEKLSIWRLIFWRTVLNWMLPFVPKIGIVGAGFNYFNISGNNTNRCIHDEMSNTLVVFIKPQKQIS